MKKRNSKKNDMGKMESKMPMHTAEMDKDMAKKKKSKKKARR